MLVCLSGKMDGGDQHQIAAAIMLLYYYLQMVKIRAKLQPCHKIWGFFKKKKMEFHSIAKKTFTSFQQYVEWTPCRYVEKKTNIVIHTDHSKAAIDGLLGKTVIEIVIRTKSGIEMVSILTIARLSLSETVSLVLNIALVPLRWSPHNDMTFMFSYRLWRL